jgi:hypothetical protein
MGEADARAAVASSGASRLAPRSAAPAPVASTGSLRMPSLGAWRGWTDATRCSTSAFVPYAARATSSSRLSPVSTGPSSDAVDRHKRPSRSAPSSRGSRRSTRIAPMRRPAAPSRKWRDLRQYSQSEPNPSSRYARRRSNSSRWRRKSTCTFRSCPASSPRRRASVAESSEEGTITGMTKLSYPATVAPALTLSVTRLAPRAGGGLSVDDGLTERAGSVASLRIAVDRTSRRTIAGDSPSTGPVHELSPGKVLDVDGSSSLPVLAFAPSQMTTPAGLWPAGVFTTTRTRASCSPSSTRSSCTCSRRRCGP